MLPTALTAVLAGALAAALATGLIGCITSFCLVPLQLLAQGDHCYGIVDEDVPTYSWIRNLLSIYVSRASFFNLNSGDADISLEMSYCRSILKMI
jgi:hypothetical protein